MVKTHHRKKNTRQRSGHGWGGKKKHRGKGSRGGAGHAGRGKHGGSKRTLIKNPKEYYGKHGFKRPGMRKETIITTQDVRQKLPAWLQQGKAKQEGKQLMMDLGVVGYTKLIAKGPAKLPVVITVKMASKGAIQKVEQAGGKIMLKKREEKEKIEKENS